VAAKAKTQSKAKKQPAPKKKPGAALLPPKKPKPKKEPAKVSDRPALLPDKGDEFGRKRYRTTSAVMNNAIDAEVAIQKEDGQWHDHLGPYKLNVGRLIKANPNDPVIQKWLRAKAIIPA